ncbi:MAG: hypothetical protein ACXVCY_13130 [Pseudobdellovibrionaceae bacterium]
MKLLFIALLSFSAIPAFADSEAKCSQVVNWSTNGSTCYDMSLVGQPKASGTKYTAINQKVTFSGQCKVTCVNGIWTPDSAKSCLCSSYWPDGSIGALFKGGTDRAKIGFTVNGKPAVQETAISNPPYWTPNIIVLEANVPYCTAGNYNYIGDLGGGGTYGYFNGKCYHCRGNTPNDWVTVSDNNCTN